MINVTIFNEFCMAIMISQNKSWNKIKSRIILQPCTYSDKVVLEPNVSPHKQIIKDDDVKECISIE